MVEGWKYVSMRDLIFEKGLQIGPFGSQLKAEEYTDNMFGIPVVMPRDILAGKISTAKIARICVEKAEYLKKHRLKTGDIVFPRRGDFSRIGLITDKEEGWICGTGCLRVRLGRNVEPKFLSSYLTQKPILEWLEANAVGQTMLNLNTEIVSNVPIYLPPLLEQRKIAEILQTWDKVIEKLQTLHAVKEKHRKGIARILFDKANAHPKTEEIALGKLACIEKGQQLNRLNIRAGEFPVWNGGVTPSGYHEDWNTEGGAITISSGGASGFVNFEKYKFWLGADCYILKSLSEQIDRDFLFCTLKSQESKIMRLSVGSGISHLYRPVLEKFKIAVPPLTEQQHIAQILTTAKEEITLLEREIETITRQKRGLMQKLLTGKWRTQP